MKDYPKLYENIVTTMKELGTEIPQVMTAFQQLHKAGTKSATLSSKNKELIALGIAIAVHCDGCIAFHVKDALKAGANKHEITETIGVAILMGGGPALVYGCDALEALKQFENN